MLSMYQINFNQPIHVFFIGIGGISMSGLAEIINKEGFKVSGSDMKASDLTKHMESLGIQVYIGQKAENIADDVDLVVYTAAIHKDNFCGNIAGKRHFVGNNNHSHFFSRKLFDNS